MALADTTVRLVRPTGKNFTLTDADGLALFVSAKGAKNWHFRFYWNGKQVRISLGTYPEVGLKEARELRDEARTLVAAAQPYLLAHRSDLTERVSENTLNGALKRMGYKDKLTGHGIRATDHLNGAKRARLSAGVGGRAAFTLRSEPRPRGV